MTTDATDPETPPTSPRRRSLAIRFGLSFLLGIALVAGAGGGALYAYGQQYTGRILPGVRIGNVDLSGLSSEAARRALTDGYASLGAGRVVIAGPDGELTIGYAEVGRRPDVDAMLAAALGAGRQGEPVADLIGVPQAAMRGSQLQPVVTYDAAKLVAAVAAVAKTIDLEPVNASLVTQPDGTFQATPGSDGRVVDQAALVASIGGEIGKLDAPAESSAKLSISTQPPATSTVTAEAARAAAERMAADIVLTRGTDSWTIRGAALRKLISFSTSADGSIVPVVDTTGIDPLLATLAKDVNQQPQEATFKLSGSKVVVGVKSHDGLALDQAATSALVVDALMARQAGGPGPALEPVVTVTHPSLASTQAEKTAPLMQEISRWKTYFHIYVNNGFGANIWIPAQIINGYVVAPGATFDYWKVVGSVTTAKGYKLGGAIINGKTEPQGALGGGICSSSTTLFNAALRAGLKMGARRNHYYYIDRYPLGLDATVFQSGTGSTQTMSWTNDTPYPVLIRAIKTRSGSIGYTTFVLYSVPNGRTVSISAPTVKNVRNATDTTQYTSSLPRGATKRVEYPVDGKDVWRTITVKENGKVIRTTTYYSHYSVITGILQVGTGGAPAPAPVATAPPATPSPSSSATP